MIAAKRIAVSYKTDRNNGACGVPLSRFLVGIYAYNTCTKQCNYRINISIGKTDITVNAVYIFSFLMKDYMIGKIYVCTYVCPTKMTIRRPSPTPKFRKKRFGLLKNVQR